MPLKYCSTGNQQKTKKMKIKAAELSTIILSILFVKSRAYEVEFDEDHNGYIVYCPCMGKKFVKFFVIDFTLIIFIKINRSLR